MTLARFGILVFVSIGSSLHSVGAEGPDWVTIFEEDFEDNPLQRLKMLPVSEPGTTSTRGSGRYNGEEHAYTLEGRMSLVHPIRAGAHVEFGLTLRFLPPGPEDPPELETDLMLVLFDRSMVGVQIHRAKQGDAPAVIKFVQQRSARADWKWFVDKRVETPRGYGQRK